MKKLFYILLASFFCFTAFCQTHVTPVKTKTDTLKIKNDTINIKPDLKSKKDSTNVKKDTVIENKFAVNYYLDNSLKSIKLQRDDILLSDYFSFSDLLQNTGGYYIANLGNPGQINPMFYEGASSKNSTIMIDGIPYNNSFYGVPDQSLVMTEDIENLEILPVCQSIMYGNSNIINISSDKKNSNKPYTYVRHIEAPYDTYMTDGIFMRNISSRSNLMTGFNYQTSLGRFKNSDYTFFGGRIRYRYILSSIMELNVSDYFTKNDRGLNRGVKLAGNVLTEESFNGDAAEVNYPNQREKYLRNLLNAQLSGFFFGDSLNASLITFSYNTENDEIKDKVVIGSVDQDITTPMKTNSFFLSYKQNIKTTAHYLTFYISALDKSTDDFYILRSEYKPDLLKDMHDLNFSLSVNDHMALSGIIDLNFGAKLQLTNDAYYIPLKERLSFYINPELYLGDITLSMQFAHFYRSPSAYEKYVADYFNYYKYSVLEEQTYLSLNSTYNSKISKFGLSVFYRKNSGIFLPGIFFNDRPLEFYFAGISSPALVFGGSFNCDVEYGRILFESKIEYNHYDKILLRKVIPEFSGYAGLYYYNRIFTDDIKIKIGINGSYYSPISNFSANAEEAFTSTELYSPDYSPQGVINLFAALKIQTATVYLGIENLLDHNYFITRVYPMNDRSFKLAVSWAFSD